jgi:outer membrane protein OmpA-like peptidoglycan-associated protein
MSGGYMKIVRIVLLLLCMMLTVNGGSLSAISMQQERYTHENDSNVAYQESKEFVICDDCKKNGTLSRREVPRLLIRFSGNEEKEPKEETEQVIQYQQPESVSHTVYFGYKAHTLPEEEKERLKGLARVLIGKGYRKFEAIGYADSKGSKEYNLILSGKRADSVTELLSSLGGEPSKSEGRGKLFAAGVNSRACSHKQSCLCLLRYFNVCIRCLSTDV